MTSNLSPSASKHDLRGSYIACAITTISAAVAMAVLIMMRGPWLDEFWTMWMADPRLNLTTAYNTRWATDLHPPLYYFIIWVLEHACGDQFRLLRLGNAFAFVFVGLSAHLWLKHRKNDFWLPIFAILNLSNPYYIAYFAELRSYFFIMTLAGCLIIQFRVIRRLENVTEDKTAIAINLCTIVFAMNLHYSASIVFSILIAGETARNIWLRRYVNAIFLFIAYGIAIIPLISALNITLQRIQPFSFVTATPLQTVKIVAAGLGLGLASNVFGICVAARRLWRNTFKTVSYIAPDLIGCLSCALILVAQGLHNHAMAIKYVLVLVPLFSAIVADILVFNVAYSQAVITGVALSAILTQIIGTIHEAQNTRWLNFSPQLALMARSCPATQVIGIDANALVPLARRQPVSGWIGVFNEGYQTVAKVSGVHITTAHDRKPTYVIKSKCATIILVEHEISGTRPALSNLLSDSMIKMPASYSEYAITEIRGKWDRLIVLKLKRR